MLLFQRAQLYQAVKLQAYVCKPIHIILSYSVQIRTWATAQTDIAGPRAPWQTLHPTWTPSYETLTGPDALCILTDVITFMIKAL